MKQILTILSLLITSIAFAQVDTFHVKVKNDGSSVDSNYINSKLAEKLNISDTAAMLASKQNVFIINVADYGAIGDSSTDNTEAVRDALSAVPESGGTVYFPSGVYLVSDSILINKNVRIVGSGMQSKSLSSPSIAGSLGSMIMQTGSNKNLFVVNKPGVSFENIGLKNQTDDAVSGAGIKFVNGVQFHLNRVSINNFYVNVDIVSAFYYTIDHCYFQDAVAYNVQIKDTTLPDAGDGVISNSVFNVGKYSGSTNIRQWSGGGLKINSCKFQRTNATTYPPYRMVDATLNVGTSILIITGNSFEDFVGGAIVAANAAPDTFNHILISNNQFAAVNYTKQHIIDIQASGTGYITNVIISGNSLSPRNDSLASIYIKNAVRGTVSGNVYTGGITNVDSLVNCYQFGNLVTGTVSIKSQKADEIPLSINATSGQTGDLISASVAGSVKFFVSKTGSVNGDTAKFNIFNRIVLPQTVYPTKLINLGGVTGSAWVGLEAATKGFIFINSTGGKSGFFTSGGNPVFAYNDNTEMSFGTTNPVSGYTALFYSSDGSKKVITARGGSGQTSNLIEWQNSAGAQLGAVDKDGNITAPNIRSTTTGTSAPTSTPTKVGEWFIDSTNKKAYVATGTSSSSDWTLVN